VLGVKFVVFFNHFSSVLNNSDFTVPRAEYYGVKMRAIVRVLINGIERHSSAREHTYTPRVHDTMNVAQCRYRRVAGITAA